MPKIRTHKGTKKRFRVTATGKVMRRQSSGGHLLEHKAASLKRDYAGVHEMSPADSKTVRRLAPYL